MSRPIVRSKRPPDGPAKRATYKHNGKLYKSETCEGTYRASLRGELVLHTVARGSYPGIRLEKNELAGLKSLGFWDATQKQSWGLQWHRNEGLQLCILSRGTLPFFCGDKSYEIKPYDLMIARPWQPHKWGDPLIDPSKLFFLILDVGVRKPNQKWQWPAWLLMNEDELAELTKLLRQNELHVWRDCREIHDCFQEIGRAIEEYPRKKDITYLALKLNELFYLLLRMFRKRHIPLNEALTSHLRSVQLFLDELPGRLGEEWTIEKMARQCCVCTSRFVQYCRQVTNQSPMHQLNTLRLNKAAELLLDPRGLSIIEIAMQCGFATSQYFANCFKREFGATPTEYRNSHNSPSRALIRKTLAKLPLASGKSPQKYQYSRA